MTFLDDALWVGQRGHLYKLDPDTGRLIKSFGLPPFVVAIATDGRLLYALDHGWTAGRPIYVIDPQSGKQVRKIVTKANKKSKVYGAGGIAWRDGRLYVLELGWGRLHQLNPRNGTVVKTIQPKERYVSSLAFDGRNFVTVKRKQIVFLNPDTGQTVSTIPVNYPLQQLTYTGGSYYAMEQPVPGYDKHHHNIRVWPKEMLIYKLTFLPPQ